MKRYYTIAGCHAIDLNEIIWFEFCDNDPITNTGKYRVKMMTRYNGMFHIDMSKREFDKLAETVISMSREDFGYAKM